MLHSAQKPLPRIDRSGFHRHSTNFCAYVDNNPVNKTDPTGLSPQNPLQSAIGGSIYSAAITNSTVPFSTANSSTVRSSPTMGSTALVDSLTTFSGLGTSLAESSQSLRASGSQFETESIRPVPLYLAPPTPQPIYDPVLNLIAGGLEMVGQAPERTYANYQLASSQGYSVGGAVYVGLGNELGGFTGVQNFENFRSGRDAGGNRLGTLRRGGELALAGLGLTVAAKPVARGVSVAFVETSSVPRTLGGLQSRIDVYAGRAQTAAWEKGLSGIEAGKYSDRYFGKAVSQLNTRLGQAGSEYRAIGEYGRTARGAEVRGMNRPTGSLFLDAVLTNDQRTTVFSAWDTRFQATPYPSWNSAAQNAAYVQRFQIQEGFVREISVVGRRP